jgi:hypothetical protein
MQIKQCCLVLSFAVTAQIFVHCALNYVPEILNIALNFANYVQKFVKPAIPNAENMPAIMIIAKNVLRLVRNVLKLVHD